MGDREAGTGCQGPETFWSVEVRSQARNCAGLVLLQCHRLLWLLLMLSLGTRCAAGPPSVLLHDASHSDREKFLLAGSLPGGCTAKNGREKRPNLMKAARQA